MTNTNTANLTGVWGTSGTDVFAVGAGGTILHYNGTSWSSMTSGTTNTLSGVWGSSGTNIFAVGASGTILFYGNSPPELASIGNKTVAEGATLSFTISATDADVGDTLTYSASNLPSGAGFDPVTRTFSWTPGYTQAGTYNNVRFTVTDNGSPQMNDYEDITITVTNVNRAPVLDPIGNKSVNEGQVLQFTITASDPDGNALTYSASNLPSGAGFNAATRTFSWTPSYTQAGTYPNVRFTVTDNGTPSPLNDYEDITITVNDVVCGNPDLPAIDFTGNWTFTPTIVGGKNVGGTLVLSDTQVTASVISSTESYIFDDTPGVEEILHAAVNVGDPDPITDVLTLVRDSANPYLFDDSTLSITETGNIYLSSSLVNIQFTVGTGPFGPRLNMNAICFNSHNLPDMVKSSNTRPSRFIDTLITEGYGPDYPNMRLTLDVLSGPGDFSSTTASSGSCGGKIESAEGPITLIDLALFEATPVNREVVVIWVTASEIDNVGFNLYRSESEIGGYVQLNSSIILAEGDSTQGETYEYVDYDVKNRKTYYYMLEDIDLYGISTFHGPISATPRLIFGGINR